MSIRSRTVRAVAVPLITVSAGVALTLGSDEPASAALWLSGAGCWHTS